MALKDLTDAEYDQVKAWMKDVCFTREYCVQMDRKYAASHGLALKYHLYNRNQHKNTEIGFPNIIERCKYGISCFGRTIDPHCRADFSEMKIDLPKALEKNQTVVWLRHPHEAFVAKNKHARLIAAIIEAQCGFWNISEDELKALSSEEREFSKPPHMIAGSRAEEIYRTRPLGALKKMDVLDLQLIATEALSELGLPHIHPKRLQYGVQKAEVSPRRSGKGSERISLEPAKTNEADAERHANLHRKRLEKRLRAKGVDSWER